MEWDREEMQRTFEAWTRETLLEELVQRGDDYIADARALMRAELLSRGTTEEEVEQAREAYLDELKVRNLPEEKLVVVRTFEDRLSGAAAEEVLSQNGIDSLLQGSDQLFFGPGLLDIGPNPVTLKVAAHDAEQAGRLLDALPPESSDAADEDDDGGSD